MFSFVWEGKREKYSMNHAKLAYVISRYATCALSVAQQETWLREHTLSVLTFEAIIAGLINLDYAPQSVLLSLPNCTWRRIWMNVSQAGRSVVADLVDDNVCALLKVWSPSSLPSMGVQVTRKGLAFVDQLDQQLKDEVDLFLRWGKVTNATGTANTAVDNRAVLQVDFVESTNAFSLRCGDKGDSGPAGQWCRRSTVTDIEDVSYVSSPYLPACLRAVRTPLESNAGRAHECRGATDNIVKKGGQSAAVILANVDAMVCEWMPFGPNHIAALNDRLGSRDGCQGGLFSDMIDQDPISTQFHLEPGLTHIRVVDFNALRFANFEAQICYPEDQGIVQVESVGTHVSSTGFVCCGVHIESILDRGADDVCIDFLCRLLSDVQSDSSAMIDDLVTPLQRHMLDCINLGDSEARLKFKIVLAEDISPRLPAAELLDRSKCENELAQLLGNISEAHDVGVSDRFFVGSEGVLMAGHTSKQDEHLLLAYAILRTYHNFISQLWIRAFILQSKLDSTDQLALHEWRKQPDTVARIRSSIKQISSDMILLEQLLSYLRESLSDFEARLVQCPSNDRARQLYNILRLKEVYTDAQLRCRDFEKEMGAARSKLKTLEFSSGLISKNELEVVTEKIRSNCDTLATASAVEQRSSASLEFMDVLFAGTLAFRIVDRFSGNAILGIGGVGNTTSACDAGAGVCPQNRLNWINQWIREPIANIPGLFFVLNMAWLWLAIKALHRLLDYINDRNRGTNDLRQEMVCNIDVRRLEAFLEARNFSTCDVNCSNSQRVVKVQWTEPKGSDIWYGQEPPKLGLEYDAQHGWLLRVHVQWNSQRNEMKAQHILDTFMSLMRKNRIILSALGLPDDDVVPTATGGGEAHRASDGTQGARRHGGRRRASLSCVGNEPRPEMVDL
eukprot:g1529.t1